MKFYQVYKFSETKVYTKCGQDKTYERERERERERKEVCNKNQREIERERENERKKTGRTHKKDSSNRNQYKLQSNV